MDGWLRLLHPIMPFITEELFCHTPGRSSDDTLLRGPWPDLVSEQLDPEAELAIEALQDVVGTVRNLRAEYSIDPGRRVDLVLVDPPPALVAALEAESDGLRLLARLDKLETADASPEGEPGAHVVLRTGGEVFLPLRDVIDLDREKQRLVAEFDHLASLLSAARSKLENPGFLERAPADVVQREREKATSLEQRYERLLEKKVAFGLD